MEPDQVRIDDGVAVIHVDGSDCAALWPLVEPSLAAPDTTLVGVVLDFSAVTYLNSMNIASVIGFRTRLAKHATKVAMCGLNEQLRSIFRVLKLERLFDLELDQSAAITKVKA